MTQFADQHDTLTEQARESLQQAMDSLSMISGAAAQDIAPYRRNLEMLLAAMEGRAIDRGSDSSASQTNGAGASPSAGPPSAPSGESFDSPEALVEFLRTLDESDVASVERLVDAIHDDSPIARAQKNFMRAMLRGMAEVMTAVEDQFGGDAVNQFEQAVSEMGSTEFGDIELIEQSDTRATARFEPAPGMPEETIELVNRNGQWMIDGDSLVDPQMAQPGQEEMTINMIEQMASSMSGQFSELTERVRNGEFDSVEQFMQAMMQAMMNSMGGG